MGTADITNYYGKHYLELICDFLVVVYAFANQPGICFLGVKV